MAVYRHLRACAMMTRTGIELTEQILQSLVHLRIETIMSNTMSLIRVSSIMRSLQLAQKVLTLHTMLCLWRIRRRTQNPGQLLDVLSFLEEQV